MNEMKRQVKTLFSTSSQEYDLPEQPSRSDLKLMGKFITGNPFVRMEILFDFWKMDYEELFSMFYKYSFQKSGDEPETFLDRCKYQSEIERLLLEIEYEVINDFKKWKIKEQDLQRTISEIQRLLKKVEKWHYVKGISDKENFVSNRIMKALEERVDNNSIKPYFQLSFSSDEEIMKTKNISNMIANEPTDQKKTKSFPEFLLTDVCENLAAQIKKIL
jgi:hypothetical protein